MGSDVGRVSRGMARVNSVNANLVFNWIHRSRQVGASVRSQQASDPEVCSDPPCRGVWGSGGAPTLTAKMEGVPRFSALIPNSCMSE